LTKIFYNKAAEIFCLEKNILFWKYNPDNYVSKEDLIEMINFSKNYVKQNGKCFYIVEAPTTMNFELNAWQYISQTNYEDDIAIAIAMHTTGIQHNLMAKSYERKVIPKSPFKVFFNFEDSIKWIKSLN
jgi:hypothetical protein